MSQPFDLLTTTRHGDLAIAETNEWFVIVRTSRTARDTTQLGLHSGSKPVFSTIRQILAISRFFRITCASYTTPWPVGVPQDVLRWHACVDIADIYSPMTTSTVLCTTVSSTLFRLRQVFVRPIVHLHGRSTFTAPATIVGKVYDLYWGPTRKGCWRFLNSPQYTIFALYWRAILHSVGLYQYRNKILIQASWYTLTLCQRRVWGIKLTRDGVM